MLFIYMYNIYLLQYICSFYSVWWEYQNCSNVSELLCILPDAFWGFKVNILSIRCDKSHPTFQIKMQSLWQVTGFI